VGAPQHTPWADVPQGVRWLPKLQLCEVLEQTFLKKEEWVVGVGETWKRLIGLLCESQASACGSHLISVDYVVSNPSREPFMLTEGGPCPRPSHCLKSPLATTTTHALKRPL
jgi:hypothetical protein